MLEQLQANIKRALLDDQLKPEGPVRSATEVAIEERERVETIGSSFGRLQTEIIDGTVQRTTHLGREIGILAQSLRADGRLIKLQHQSPLARAQDMDELMTLARTLEVVTPLGPEVLALGLKVEEIPDWVAQKAGLDPRLRRTEGEREQLQEQAAQIIAATQQAAA